jgi:transcriptional regulator with XRE-family HTH domain
MSQPILESWDERRNYLAGNGRLNLRTYNFRVSTAKTQVFVPAARLGELLRQWRSTRRMSQLDLALEADISSRHLSYIESGKSQPSREMVTRLADALTIPLRERNALLIAAGYAPIYRETGLTTPEMTAARRAVEMILKQQEPYPAIVMDRHWNLQLANDGARKFLALLLDKAPDDPNVVRQIFREDILRPFINNWDEVAADMIRRLHQEVDWFPTDDVLPALLDEVLAYPGVPEHWRRRELETSASPLLEFKIRKGDLELSFFSTWTTFGSPHDVTLEEMRIESSFPSDDATAKRWQEVTAKL